MDSGLRSRLVLVQIWCGVLSVAVVVLAALQLTPRTRATEESTVKPPTVGPTAHSLSASLKSERPSLSYIQLIPQTMNSWVVDTEISHDVSCGACSLFLQNNWIHCRESGLYQVYAQVTFTRKHNPTQTLSVTLTKNRAEGRAPRVLVQASFHRSEETVFVSKLVSLLENDTVSIEINGDYLTQNTFWGMIQLRKETGLNVSD